MPTVLLRGGQGHATKAGPDKKPTGYLAGNCHVTLGQGEGGGKNGGHFKKTHEVQSHSSCRSISS